MGSSSKMASTHGFLFEDIGLAVPQLVLPRAGSDLTKWSVVACDQYTSEPAYWKRVADFVGTDPSMLKLIYPEVHLPEKRDDEIIAGILTKYKEYASTGILEVQEPGFMLVDRKTPAADSRKGLVVALDLELYSFAKGSQSMIRPTEATIEARLPPRIAIRKDAPMESPHILVLIDDPERTVIEPLFAKKADFALKYDFDLMESSGHLTGYHVTSQDDVRGVADALRKLATKERFQEKYGAANDQSPILFAVGDGNHSLATAKKCWEAAKAAGAGNDHPARYALVELNNVHDHGLRFQPIHRLVEHVDAEHIEQNFRSYFEDLKCKVSFESGAKLEDKPEAPGVHRIGFCSQMCSGVFTLGQPKMVLAVATLDSWLNIYIAENKTAQLDYVHEAYTIEGKCREDTGTVGFFLPAIDKNDLVKTVVKEGTLPRKTFSMGHAPEKRFYFECRAIVPQQEPDA